MKNHDEFDVSSQEITPTDFPQPVSALDQWTRPFKNALWMTGFVLLLLSVVMFSVGMSVTNASNFAQIFPMNFLLVFIYTIVLLANKSLKWWLFGCKTEHYDTFFIYLGLWLISCFALNREVAIFNESTPWLSVHLVLSVIACIGYAWKDVFPPTIKAVWYGSLAWTAVLMGYFAVYLLPVSMLSVLVFWFFGLSLHSFIPLVFFIHLVRILLMAWEEKIPSSKGWISPRFGITAGILIPLAIAVGFGVQWHKSLGNIKHGQQQAILQKESQLPSWVTVSQYLRPDWITEKVLKADIYYQTPRNSDNFFDVFNVRSGGLTKHDPLVYLTQVFIPSPRIGETDRLNLLRTLFDGRHDLQDKLWTGADLRTESIVTHAKIDPALHLSYTEKTLQINNTSMNKWMQEEAAYTFYLPEGAVVSSLSLWVNGVEQPARLSARSKADSAYSTIVGRERRDPSIVHWQEGNTVTLRVFPCTTKEDRQFKVGITAPLREEDGQLVYENISFQGPPATGSKEAIRLELPNNAEILEKPWYLKAKEGNTLECSESYRQNWQVKIKSRPFEEKSFSFNGKNYRATPFSFEKSAFQAETLYADLDQNWSTNELESLLKAAAPAPVKYWSTDHFETITHDNLKTVLDNTAGLRFALFPFHQLANAEKALVVSKSVGSSPILADLKGSKFGKGMIENLPNTPHIRVFHLGMGISPYLRSLAEFRVLNLHHGKLPELLDLLKNHQFYKQPETANSVVIPSAGLCITETLGEQAGGAAPDHLMRLFAYNDIMKQVGPYFMNQRFEPTPLVNAAEEAFVVTPVSSLVVLETEADYDRFDIQNSKNSLQNATLKGSGAVPEPHEWLLLSLLFLSLLWVWKRKF